VAVDDDADLDDDFDDLDGLDDDEALQPDLDATDTAAGTHPGATHRPDAPPA